MSQHIQAINSVVDSASFNSVNLLQMPKDGSHLTNGSSAIYVTSYAGGTVQTIDISTSDFVIFNPNYAGEGAMANRVANYGALDGRIVFPTQNATTGSWGTIVNGMSIFNDSIGPMSTTTWASASSSTSRPGRWKATLATAFTTAS
ncbi:hypothetical protein [Rhizobium leguminosarum]